MLPLLFSHAFPLSTLGQELATKRITIVGTGNEFIDLTNNKGYIHTQDYCPTGIINVTFGNHNNTKLTYNNCQEIINDTVNVSYYDVMGGYFIFDLFVLDKSIHCDNVYSVSNMKNVEIYGKGTMDCFLFSQMTSTTATVINPGTNDSILYQENGDFGSLKEKKQFGKLFMIGITGDSAVKLETEQRFVSDWTQKIKPYRSDDGTVTNIDPYVQIGTRVEWWVWTVLFGVSGLILVIFLSFLCTPVSEDQGSKNYYWLSHDEYVISTQLLLQNEA